MEVLYSQRYSYARIVRYKNYSRLINKPQSTLNNFDYNLNEVDDGDFFRNLDDITTKSDDIKAVKYMYEEASPYQYDYKSSLINFNPKEGKKNIKFFYNTENKNGIGERIKVDYAKKGNVNEFETSKDRHIKHFYPEPFCSISINLIEKKIVRNGDKITIKIYRQNKKREFNWRFFKKSSSIVSFTMNMVTGDFVTLDMSINPANRSKRFRKNGFSSLKDHFGGHSRCFNTETNFLSTTSKLYPEFKEIFDDEKFKNEIYKALEFSFVEGFDDGNHGATTFLEQLGKKFVELKKIKIPNEYMNFLVHEYPTEKFLKKNDRKLIAAILDRYMIKSNVNIKLLHQYPNIDVSSLSKISYLFGLKAPKYIGNIKSDAFPRVNYAVNNNYGNKTFWIKELLTSLSTPLDTSDNDRENIVRIINSRDSTKSNTRAFDISEFLDHFIMLKTIREYDPKREMRARTYEEFHVEHMEFSRLINAIRRATVIKYVFDPKMVETIETPIKTSVKNVSEDGMSVSYEHYEFYPHLLTTEDEYQEEGQFMHHCVGGYANKDRSIIISLRSKDHSERVTSEFDIESGACIQSRYTCNQNPPVYYEESLQILRKVVKKFAEKGKLKWLEKTKVPLKINGIEVKPFKDLLPQPVFIEMI